MSPEQADLGSSPEMRQAAKRMIDIGAKQIDQIRDDNIRRRLMSIMARLYRTMDFLDEARPLLERAAEVDLQAPGSLNGDTFQAFNTLGTVEAKSAH